MSKGLIVAGLLGAAVVGGGAYIAAVKTIVTEVKQGKYYEVVYENGIPAIYLSTEIGGPDDYRSLIAFINSVKAERIKLYLSGNGGRVDGAAVLSYAMESSGKKFDVIVYGDVYSAHAFLAVNGETLTAFDDNVIFLFHYPAVNNGAGAVSPLEACQGIIGEDRGVSNQKKCEEYANKTTKAWNKGVLARMLNLLTPSERLQYEGGEDVLIEWGVLKQRMGDVQKG